MAILDWRRQTAENIIQMLYRRYDGRIDHSPREKLREEVAKLIPIGVDAVREHAGATVERVMGAVRSGVETWRMLSVLGRAMPTGAEEAIIERVRQSVEGEFGKPEPSETTQEETVELDADEMEELREENARLTARLLRMESMGAVEVVARPLVRALQEIGQRPSGHDIEGLRAIASDALADLNLPPKGWNPTGELKIESMGFDVSTVMHYLNLSDGTRLLMPAPIVHDLVIQHLPRANPQAAISIEKVVKQFGVTCADFHCDHDYCHGIRAMYARRDGS